MMEKHNDQQLKENLARAKKEFRSLDMLHRRTVKNGFNPNVYIHDISDDNAMQTVSD